MTYTVTWTLTAIQQLNQLSTTATDPRSVQRAAAFIDYVLRRCLGTWASHGPVTFGFGTRALSGFTTLSMT
jgi:hypothetical protein